ncbi:Zinc finger protein CONSTANS-LIKE 15 [Hirschfeldia incana]|nr:Zinc finger protein CONSTANS-LIKE 15 [Hirschfeldia incana]
MSSSTERVPCDFCNDRTAVLFCRADAAKLCLPCDHHVHTANLLSKKHVRSQICDNCGNEPVSVRCFTDSLVLCQECDWDVHGSCSSVSDAHVRSAVEGFTGCPSALELADLWGIDLEGRKEEKQVLPPMMMTMESFGMELDSWISGSNVFQELVVPVPKETVFKKGGGSSCGRYKQVLCKQLEELLKGDDGDREGEGTMVPEMQERLRWRRDEEEISGGAAEVNQQPPTTSFTSLLWNAANPSDGQRQSTQIWDFNLGQSREPEDNSRVEAAYDIKYAASFKINSSVEAKKNEIFQDDYNQSTTSGQVPATSENSNLHVTFGSEKGSNSSSELHFTENIAGGSCKTTRLVATKADLERLAQNRDNAMQRYKEKRKNRR